MLQIHRIVNDYQHSCTYILYEEDCEYAWLVDCGEASKVEDWLFVNKKVLRGVFLTHCHNDHIYGLMRILEIMPDISVCLSAHEGIKCVQDVRMNLSKYTSGPFRVFSKHFIELNDEEEISLFPDAILVAKQAEGHSPDSMVFQVGNWLFTGDAYIPPLEVVTKLPGADKAKAKSSLEMIKKLINNEQLSVLPGHNIEM